MQGSIRKRGDKWYYSFEMASENGKRKRIERVGGRTKTEAQKALRDALAEYEKTGQVFQPSKMSFSDYLDFWVENYVLNNCGYNSEVAYKQAIRLHIKPNIGHLKLNTLTPATLQNFINSKHQDGYANNTLKILHNVVCSSLKYAVYPCQYIKENPALYVKMPKNKGEQAIKSIKNKVISTEQFEKMLNFLKPCYRLPYLLAYYMGCRRGEVLALTWNDIDFKLQEISIDKTLIKGKHSYYLGSPKTKSSIRKIKIGNSLIDALKKYKVAQMQNKLHYGKYYINYYEKTDTREITAKEEGNSIFFICTKENGKLILPSNLQCSAVKIRKEFNVPFTFHYLRHTFTTRMIESGVNPKTVQAFLGHKDPKITLGIYTQVTEEMKNQAVEILEKSNYLPAKFLNVGKM